VVVLDRGAPAQGSTAASTALVQYENDTHLVDLVKSLGAERATLAYRASVQSFALLETRFPELLAQCDYQRRESVYVASNARAVATLEAELAARRAIGINVDWIGEDELRRRHGCHRPGALVSPLAATIDPLRFTRAVLSGCARHGVQVYSRSEVQGIDEVGGGLQLRVAGGHGVRACHVVVAGAFASMLFAQAVADIDIPFALVTKPLPDAGRVAGLAQIWESARPYVYLRGTGDGRIMLGGADVPFKSAAARELLLPRQIRQLASAYEDLFGEKLPGIEYVWAGSFGKTRDGLPYIGRVPGWNPRLSFALCYGGNGITFAAHAGDMIRAAIEDRAHPLDAVFGFARLGTDLANDTPGLRAPGGVAAS
jgi:glycine/D-amino acid oxidase-like deaminating enzyme